MTASSSIHKSQEDTATAKKWRSPQVECEVASHFLLRVCAFPEDFHRSFQLTLDPTFAELRSQVESTESDLADSVSECLHAYIGDLYRSGRNALARDVLRLRRNLYNRRVKVVADLRSRLANLIAFEPDQAIGMWLNLHTRLETIIAQNQNELAKQINTQRRHLKESSKSTGEVANAVLSASRTLYHHLLAYESVEDMESDKGRRQCEEALSAYIARMTMRPTPYGRFASVGYGRWEAGAQRHISLGAAVERVNVTLDQQFISRLARCGSPELDSCPDQRYYLNETLWEDDWSYYVYAGKNLVSKVLADDNGEYRIIIRKTRVITSLIDYLRRVKEGASLNDLQAVLSGESARPDLMTKAAALIDKLIRAKVIIKQENDTVTVMRRAQDVLQDASAAPGANLYQREIALAITNIQYGDVLARAAAYDDIDFLAQHLPDECCISSPTARSTTLHEDAICAMTPIPVCSQIIATFAQDIGDLLSLTKPASVFDPAMARLVELLDTADNRSDAGNDFFDIWNQFETSITVENPFDVAKDSGVGSGLDKRLAADYAACIDASLSVWRIDVRQLGSAIAALGDLRVSPTSSSNLFVEFCTEDRARVAVVNSMASGFGRYFSRFAEAIENGPENFGTALKCYNEQFDTDDIIFCDIRGSSFGHNANRHPRLTRFSIRYPNGRDRTSSEDIELTSLKVRRSKVTGLPELIHVTDGKRVVPLHLGFVQEGWMPRLHQFLMLFGCTHSASPFTLQFEASVESAIQLTRSPVAFYPRIMLGNLIVRRSLYRAIPTSFPVIESGISVDAYERIHSWWHDHSLPNPCLIAAIRQPSAGIETMNFSHAEPDEGPSKSVHIDAMPDPTSPSWLQGHSFLFCDIENFLSLSLIAKHFRKREAPLWIAEYIPAEPLVEVNGHVHRSEVLIEAKWTVTTH